MRQTLWSFEVPLAHLHDFDDLQDYYFALSMLCSREGYSEYMRSKSSYLVILDNSYNERLVADSAADLYQLKRRIGARFVIAPDSPAWDAHDITRGYMQMREFVPADEIFVVVRTPEMREQLRGLGASNFAVSYWIKVLYAHTRDWCDDCHFLGLLNPQEIIDVKPLSCDTSMPIKIALKGQTLDEWILEGCPHINTKDLGPEGSDFWNIQMSNEQLDLARANIMRLKEMTRHEETRA